MVAGYWPSDQSLSAFCTDLLRFSALNRLKTLRGGVTAPQYRPAACESEDSASPANAWNSVAELPATLPDRRPGGGAPGLRCRISRSSDFCRALHRRPTIAGGTRCGRRCDGGDRRWRDRGHPGCIADAAWIVDRTVESPRIPRPRRNPADAGILGRRRSGSGHKTQHRNAQQCGPAGDPAAGGG